MIVKFISRAGKAKIGSCRSVARYLEDNTHVADIIATRGLKLSPPSKTFALGGDQDPGTSKAEEMDGLDRLVAYIDDRAKTGASAPRIGADAIEAMEERAALRPKIGDAWIHLTIAYAHADRASVTDQIMADDAASLIHELVEHENQFRLDRAERRGMRTPKLIDESSLLYVVATHREKQHIHSHLLLCRIDAQGQLYNGQDNWTVARRWAMDTERKRGFVYTPEHRGDRVVGDRPGPRSDLVVAMQAVADASADRLDLDRRLAEHGLVLEESPKRGYVLVDGEGNTIQASDAGLVGRRSPDRIGRPTPQDAARHDLWEAVEQADDWSSFEDRLTERKLVAKTDGAGRVRSIARLDDAGKPVRGERWAPRQMGVSRPVHRGDNAWFQARRRKREAPSRPSAPPKTIRLPKRDDRAATMAALEAFVADRGMVRDRIEAREKAEAERRQETARKLAPSASAPSTSDRKAEQDAATKRKVEAAVAKSLQESKPFGQQGDPTTMAMRLRAKGVQAHYDDRTKSWYAGIGDVLVPLPSLAGREPKPGMAMGAAPTPAAPRPVLSPTVDAPKAPSTGPSIPRPPTPPMPDLPKRHRGPSR